MRKIILLGISFLVAFSVKTQNSFSDIFNHDIESVFDTYEAHAVNNATIEVKQINPDGSTIDNPDLSSVSAPCKITFNGGSDNIEVYYYTWYIYFNDEPNYIVKYTDKYFTYTFDKSGKYKVVLQVAEKNAEEDDYEEGEVNINIPISVLDIPNYFSPYGSSETNKIFKVKHQSIIKFRCTIFNRWGVKLYQFTDPDGEWDGKYKGKLVTPGVYFYVIEATGSDGEKYKKMGDINIL